MSGPRHRARGVLAILAALALGLSACSDLPRSGPVSSASPLQPAAQAADFVAGGPQPGASPSEIVQGFTTALSAGYSEEGFQVAREFLTAAAAATWDPHEAVRISEEGSSQRVTTGDDGGVTLSTGLGATVDRDGDYVEAAPGATVELDFTLVRATGGEWRIAELEDGVLLSPYVFGTVFSAQPLYFLTTDRTALVPDLRWLPRNDIGTRVVDELLEGPTDLLSEVVESELPEDLGLATGSVELTPDGIAAVDLTEELAALPEPQRSLAGTQLERTLFGIPAVREVSMTSDGDRVEFDPEVGTLTSYPLSSNLDPLALQSGAVVRLDGGDAELEVQAARVGATDARAVGQSYDGTLAVVLEGDSQLRTVDMRTGATGVMLTGAGLTAPSVDRYGWVWAGDGEGRLWAMTPTGMVRTVEAPWLTGRRVTSVAVSREGSRVVVGSAGAPQDDTAIHAAGVVRSATGEPTSLSETRLIGRGIASAMDMAWVEDTMVAVLGREAGEMGQPVIHLVTIGGTTRSLSLVEGAASITASRGSKSLLVGTEDGSIWVRNGASWREDLSGGVHSPAYPG